MSKLDEIKTRTSERLENVTINHIGPDRELSVSERIIQKNLEGKTAVLQVLQIEEGKFQLYKLQPAKRRYIKRIVSPRVLRKSRRLEHPNIKLTEDVLLSKTSKEKAIKPKKGKFELQPAKRKYKNRTVSPQVLRKSRRLEHWNFKLTENVLLLKASEEKAAKQKKPKRKQKGECGNCLQCNNPVQRCGRCQPCLKPKLKKKCIERLCTSITSKECKRRSGCGKCLQCNTLPCGRCRSCLNPYLKKKCIKRKCANVNLMRKKVYQCGTCLLCNTPLCGKCQSCQTSKYKKGCKQCKCANLPSKHKRVYRCGNCLPCNTPPCGKCKSCVNPKYKKACKKRRCANVPLKHKQVYRCGNCLPCNTPPCRKCQSCVNSKYKQACKQHRCANVPLKEKGGTYEDSDLKVEWERVMKNSKEKLSVVAQEKGGTYEDSDLKVERERVMKNSKEKESVVGQNELTASELMIQSIQKMTREVFVNLKLKQAKTTLCDAATPIDEN